MWNYNHFFVVIISNDKLDALIGELDSEYSETALDRKLYQTILKLDIDAKEKLLKTLEIWTK